MILPKGFLRRPESLREYVRGFLTLQSIVIGVSGMPICQICGNDLKNPRSKSHTNSKYHKAALKRKGIAPSVPQAKITKPKRTPRKTRSTQQTLDTSSLEPLIMEIINPYLKGFEMRIIALEKRIESSILANSGRKEFRFDSFSSSLRSHYEQINTVERRGGMVPIPKLWDKLQIEGFSRDDFVNGLFELERQRTIELQTASDPKVVRDVEKAIDHPSRGLINYVIWRR